MLRRAVWLGLVTSLLATAAPRAQGRARLEKALRDATAPLFSAEKQLCYSLRAFDSAATKTASRPEPRVEIVLDRIGADAFRLRGKSPWASFVFVHRADRTVLALPELAVAFVGEGRLEGKDDTLSPEGLVARLLGPRRGAVGLLHALLPALPGKLALLQDGPEPSFALGPDLRLTLPAGREATVRLSSTARRGLFKGLRRFELSWREQPFGAALSLAGMREVKLPRAALEKLTFRALRRLLSIEAPTLAGLRRPRARKLAHGELRHVGTQDLVLLSGTPEQIGRAHGELLGEQVVRTLDSTFYLVGLVETVRTGKWFPKTLAAAFARLEPHIPLRHQRELEALAASVPGVSARELRLANVFPEYFHCSGFAVFGSATKDGTLYHGRVLDYMTLIGLQQSAVAFLIAPQGRRAFFTAGFAGFTGVVSGMNDRQISLGEMGGRGRGAWDGVPMATLMRRALEECTTLGQVQALWRNSPRTCEYFYVFADGKIPDAVGVEATPERIGFLRPGEAHERLGPGIEDAVVMSAGRRLETLRARIQKAHGKIDETVARHLMDRPVAMHSNLHNVLFAPAKGLVWIANAGAGRPAAERPYERYDVRDLFAQVAARERTAQTIHATTIHATDTLDPGRDPSADAREMLDGFGYVPTSFLVSREAAGDWSDAAEILRFPSPRPSGDPRNDTVVLEWYPARVRGKRPAKARAMLVLHILDGRMRVARGFARALSAHGFHAFVMHMPDYGLRGTRRARKDPSRFVARCRQAVADARRARDAIAALPGVDADHVSLQGTSLGGFVAALAGSLDHAFDPVFLMLAGGDLAGMFRHGAKDTAKIARRLRAAGRSRATIEGELYAIEPTRIAHRLDPSRTWLYSAKDDRVVPAAQARALARAAGLDGRHHLWLPGGHYTAALHLPWVLADMLDKLGTRNESTR